MKTYTLTPAHKRLIEAKHTRRQYARAWKAWRKACAIRAAHRGSAPVKKWYDECRVMLARAERQHRKALRGMK